MSLDVAPVTRADESAFDAFVAAHPHGMMQHTTRYRDMLVELTGARPHYLAARSGNDILGVIPLLVSQAGSERVVNSLPFYGGPGGILGHDPETRAALAGAYEETLAKLDAAAATLVDPPHPDHHVPPLTRTHEDWRIGLLTRVKRPGDLDNTLFPLLESRTRRAIRRARKAGIEVGVDNSAFDALRTMHEANMAAIAGNPKPPSFYSAWQRHLRPGEDYDLYVARREGEIVSALLVGHHPHCDEYYMPAIDHAHREDQPNAAVVYDAMRRAAASGRTWWNWGGTWVTQHGVYQFKKQWDPVETRYDYHVNVRDPEILARSPAELKTSHPHFYVAPYSALRGNPA